MAKDEDLKAEGRQTPSAGVGRLLVELVSLRHLPHPVHTTGALHKDIRPHEGPMLQMANGRVRVELSLEGHSESKLVDLTRKVPPSFLLNHSISLHKFGPTFTQTSF